MENNKSLDVSDKVKIKTIIIHNKDHTHFYIMKIIMLNTEIVLRAETPNQTD